MALFSSIDMAEASLRSKVWELLRRVLFAVLVQRFPGRKHVPKIREVAYRRALEVIRRAVGTLAHQNEISTLIEPERRIIHASDRQVPRPCRPPPGIFDAR